MNKHNRPHWLAACLCTLLILTLSGCSNFQDKEKTTKEISLPEESPKDDQIPEAISSELGPVSNDNLWKEIVQGYGLPHVDDPIIENNLRWYANNQAYLDRALGQSTLYLYHVTNKIRENNLPAELALLPVVESSYNPFAVSPSNAVGIWQFVSRTGRSFGLAQNHWYDGRRDLIASTDAAIAYLKYLHNMFDGDWLVAIAAYNAGEGTVSRAIKKNKRAGKPIDFWSLSLPKQTRSYIPQLLALAKVVADPEKYELQLQAVPNLPYFTEITVNTPIDLSQAAKMAEINPSTLRNLNAGYNRWITNPTGPYQLLVPITHAEQFSAILDQLPPIAPIKIVAEYKVKSGDTLGAIARRYKTSVSNIQTMNSMKTTRIKPGQMLTIPGLVKIDHPSSAAAHLAAIQSSSAASTDATSTSNTLNARINTESGEATPYETTSYEATPYEATPYETTTYETISKGIYYTVKSGDSFWKIARKYNTTVDKLCRMNNLSSKSKLQPKQKLLVVSNSVIKRDGNKITYQIEHGDTLHLIANKFAVSKQELLSWNTVKDESYIHPGQELTIYVNAKN